MLKRSPPGVCAVAANANVKASKIQKSAGRQFSVNLLDMTTILSWHVLQQALAGIEKPV
jgi:hypothetical protein